MNILFIKFLLMFLASLGVLSALTWAVIKKKVLLRDVYVSLIFSVGAIVLIMTQSIGRDLNDELTIKFHISKEKISYVNYQDSTINDSLLYSTIKNLRIPHAKIVFAQAKLESGSYKSELYKTNYNLFGMRYATKRPTTTNNEYMGYQMYDNWRESVLDYLIWQFSHNVDRLTD